MFLAGVAHKIPYEALITAKDSYDPKDCGPEDETIEEDDGSGKVKLLRDWSKPPVSQRCQCQKMNRMCSCGKGAKPAGVSLQLYWDKVNNMNR